MALTKGQNIALVANVASGKGTCALYWEPEPPLPLDPRAGAVRAAPVDAAAVSTAIACWNRNGSVTRKGQGLSCIDTPQELRRLLTTKSGGPGLEK